MPLWGWAMSTMYASVLAVAALWAIAERVRPLRDPEAGASDVRVEGEPAESLVGSA